MSDYSDLRLMAECAIGFSDVSLAPDVLLELIRDAERYRWIKKESELSSYEDSYSLPIVHAWEYKPGPELNEQFASLDEAIDYVMNSSPENPS